MSVLQISFEGEGCLESIPCVSLPGSKSMAARMLILDYIRGNDRVPCNFPDCDDSRELYDALRQLRENKRCATYDLGSGATSLRFFTALVASLENFEGVVDCSPQLRKRPFAQFVEALRGIGADIKYMKNDGSTPIYIRGRKLRGGNVSIDGSVSSQFISSLLMVSSLWDEPLKLDVSGEVVSYPYLNMTKRMIAQESDLYIEPDWSAAAFFYEMCMVSPGHEIMIKALVEPNKSLQGDAGSKKVFDLLGIESRWQDSGAVSICGKPEIIRSLSELSNGVKLDLGSMPDLVPALAMGLALSGIKFRLYNVSHLRYKESDRLSVLKSEMAKVGYLLDIGDDYISWGGAMCHVSKDCVIDSHGDHRIAMAFAIAAAKLNCVNILDADCVAKSFPRFFDELGKLGFKVKER